MFHELEQKLNDIQRDQRHILQLLNKVLVEGTEDKMLTVAEAADIRSVCINTFNKYYRPLLKDKGTDNSPRFQKSEVLKLKPHKER